MIKRLTILTFSLSLFVFLLHQSATAEPAAPETSPEWMNPTMVSTNSPYGAKRPFMAAAPNGKTIMIVYNRQMSGNDNDRDPYYSLSTNNGNTWSSSAAIHNSPGTSSDSVKVNVVFDSTNKAHAVWTEDLDLKYAGQNSWPTNNGGNPPQTLSSPTLSPGASDAVIVASGNNTLDVVWSEPDSGGAVQINHARSTNGGASWPIKGPVADTPPTSRVPAVAVEAGVIHVVWEENEIPNSVIYYARSTSITSSSVTWSAPVPISDQSNPQANARQPRIIADGNTLHVSFTDYISQNSQSVHHLQCSAQCTTPGNWSNPSSNPVSGQLVGANANSPYDVFGDLAQHGRCTYLYFHGTTTTNNEIILGVNSCDGWTGSARDEVTTTQTQSLAPNLAGHNDWWLYLTFEAGTADGIHQIYFVRNKPGLYLPVIQKR